MEEEYVVESLSLLRNSIDVEEAFVDAVFSIRALLVDSYRRASPSLRSLIYEVVCHVASTLETKYTECEFWLAGKMLFEEAERQVTDSSEREYMKTCTARTYEYLVKTVNQPEDLDSVLHGQLPMDTVPSRPTLQVLQELVATLGCVAGISVAMRETSSTSRRASDLMEDMVNSMEEVNGIQDILQSIDASLQGTTAPMKSPPASKNVIEKLPVITISEEIMARLGSDMECTVCREKFDMNEKMYELPCKHMFHLPCLKRWLDEHNSCPVCRRELPTDDVVYETWKQQEREAKMNELMLQIH